MWLLIFNQWHKKENKKLGDIKQYIHLQKGLKTKQMIIILTVKVKTIIITIIAIIIIAIIIIMIITIIIIIIIIIIIKRKQNTLNRRTQSKTGDKKHLIVLLKNSL